MQGWNFADIWEAVAARLPDAAAQVQGERVVTWRQFDERANGVAFHLLQAGLREQDKVALYLYNGPEYLEAMFAAFKGGFAPVNTNYRYTSDELVYLWDDADAAAVVFHGTFAEGIDQVRGRLPLVRSWLWVDDGTGPCPPWATPYEQAAASHPGRASGSWGRSGDHLNLLYTGGTTGMPKGVMWRQDDLVRNILGGSFDPRFRAEPQDLALVDELITRPGMAGLPVCPLMHGTGCFTQLRVLSGGGCTVTLVDRTFAVDELLSTIEHRRVKMIAIVGDSFAKPMIRALDASPGRWDLSSLAIITSSGVMFSEESKRRLLVHVPKARIVDAFSSSEALGMGQSVSAAGDEASTATFTVGPDTRVIDDDGADVIAGSGQLGKVAVGGFQPIGYYKDPVKSASTFQVLDGHRYSIPGDVATVDADGTILLQGRGSLCINTGGEKVFPEEVEEVLKTHHSISDAVAVATPDERFGEVVTAVVEMAEGSELDEAAIIAHVKTRLAGYKAPKRVLAIETIGRAPNGKVDYKRIGDHARATLGRPAG